MGKRRVFKITEDQLKEFDSTFNYFAPPEDADVNGYSGNVDVGVTGMDEPGKYGDPPTTDDLASSMSNTYYNSGLRCYGAPQPDVNEDFIFGNDENSDEKDQQQLQKSLPSNIKRPLDMLVSALRLANPTPDQRAFIMNQLLQVVGLDKIPSTARMQFGKDINNPNIFKQNKQQRGPINSGLREEKKKRRIRR